MRTAAVLGLLALAAPLDLALVGAASVAGRVRGAGTDHTRQAARRRTVLLTGGKMTKALHLARAFHRAGHRVVLVETPSYRWTAHRFSRCVDAFHLVEPPDSPGYAASLLRVVEAEGVDVVVPVCAPASSIPDAEARALLDEHCEVVHPHADDVRRVDDKAAFAALAAELGLAVPDTHRVASRAEAVEVVDSLARSAPGVRYVLKSIVYDPVRRLDLTPLPRPTRAETETFVAGLPIDAEHPWIVQEWVAGTEFCTHGTVREGRLRAYVCCRSSAFQLSYEAVEHPGVRDWVERFVAATDLTGQLSFDLMERPDGTVVGIECNPRPHSAVTLLREPRALAAAYLDQGHDQERDQERDQGGQEHDQGHDQERDQGGQERAWPIEPALGDRPTYWLHHEIWQVLRHPRSAGPHLRLLRRGRDAVLDAHDPWPFWLLYHLQLPSLLVDAWRRGRPWLRLDPNIGKLVAPAGD
ncbi:ATP-grasp enzyme [Nocardioides sp. CBS4Y-1]|uniref:ATP-grasp enzyme n=1 Tax=Nocardioides acrostichi TaxID=2784339 RepID=A0A930Y4J9_9ACTN|nr:ATP-grasp enzyme [Nocardioides acrostichi]